MAKETSIISEKVVDKIMEGLAKIVERENEIQERKDQMKNEEYAEQKQMLKEEFNRVMAQLKKLKPGTDEYDAVAESLHKIRNVIQYF